MSVFEPVGQWHVVAVAGEEHPDFSIEGIRVWDHQWERVEAPPVIPHGETTALSLWRVSTEGDSIVFAAEEVSPNAWMFALPGQKMNG